MNVLEYRHPSKNFKFFSFQNNATPYRAGK